MLPGPWSRFAKATQDKTQDKTRDKSVGRRGRDFLAKAAKRQRREGTVRGGFVFFTARKGFAGQARVTEAPKAARGLTRSENRYSISTC
jgi:hypothetical protein